MGFLPHILLLPYLTANCSVHLKMYTFAHNDHNEYVNFAMNLTEKCF